MRTVRFFSWACGLALAAFLFANESDAAYGFTYPVAVNSNASTDSRPDEAPFIATDRLGKWMAVWTATTVLGKGAADADIFKSVSLDNGLTWSPVTTLNPNAGSDSKSWDSKPAVSTDGLGHWVAVWAIEAKALGWDQDIACSYSLDDGVTWSTPFALNKNAATDITLEHLPQILSDRAGHWIAAWQSGGVLGTEFADRDIKIARSSDNGQTWTEEEVIWPNDANETDPAICTDEEGTWLLAWSAYEYAPGWGEDYDVVVSTSTDDGATWTQPIALNTNATSDSGWDYGPRLATNVEGRWVAVWTRFDTVSAVENDIISATSDDNGATWSPPQAVHIDASVDMRSEDSPQIAMSTYGGDACFAVWWGYDVSKADYGDCYVARSTDGGSTWGSFYSLNIDPAEKLTDMSPSIAADMNGQCVVVWQLGNEPDRKLKDDADIYATTVKFPQEFEIISPNGGETFTRGVLKKMKWTSTLDANEKVRIEVWRNGERQLVEGSTLNDGVYKVLFPEDAEVGGGYSMRIILKYNHDIVDESDATFRVK